MLCYRDMCFCPYYKDCKDGQDCFRALIPDVRRNAESRDLPVDQFMGKPKCFKEKQ